ncbi:hypothetical protein OY671_000369 [Metschnikowia pulcherrima]|nr:hypothetical protein OY671_000369 [Metschnikowia pulcherrima]
MSENGKPEPSLVCPICRHTKYPTDHAIVCGNCAHENTELLRNSVIQNEAQNAQMRAQIDAIFKRCRDLNRTGRGEKNETSVGGKAEGDALGILSDADLPQPDSATITSLAINLSKLEQKNRKMKLLGLQKSCESLEKKNALLETKIQETSRKQDESNQIFKQKENQLLEDYSRKLEYLDREIISFQYERMRRNARQAVLKQYSHFKVIKERFFGSLSSGIEHKGLTFCNQPVLQISAFLECPIATVNTFLEDLIRLQVVLFDLFTIDDKTLHLRYLDYLRKLLPDRKFYESMQAKIDKIMQHDQAFSEDALETEPDTKNVESESRFSGLDVTEDTSDKITIKDKQIRVPKSFRTMNLQRRSSLKEADVSEQSSYQEESLKGNKSAFVMVAQNTNLDLEQLSPKSTIGASQKHETIQPVTQTSTPISLNSSVSRSHGTSIPGDSFHGKKFVVVPHKILSKPFTKLRPNEYLKFVSIVVKILVTFNEFFLSVLGPLCPTSHENTPAALPVLGSSRTEPDARVKEPFMYDLGQILGRIASMDTFFEMKLRDPSMPPKSPSIAPNYSNMIEASQMTSFTEENNSMRESWAYGSINPGLPIPALKFQGVKDLYSKLVSRKRGPQTVPIATSVSDDIIYGMVSETATKEDHIPAKQSVENERSKAQSLKHDSAQNDGFSSLDIQEISKTVHGLISRKIGDRARHSAAKLDRGANSMMQQSRAHLDDWDVVSKMF